MRACVPCPALTVDRIDNRVLCRKGEDPSLPTIVMGSHLDTQPTGGKFDGVPSVPAGLEVLRAMHKAGVRTKAPVVLVNWTNEEGARFSPPMMGSGVAVGVFTEEEVLAKRDPEGRVFGEELARIGWRGEADPAWAKSLGGYIELHIDQGPVLEAEGKVIGAVTSASGQAWFDVDGAGGRGASACWPVPPPSGFCASSARAANSPPRSSRRQRIRTG